MSRTSRTIPNCHFATRRRAQPFHGSLCGLVLAVGLCVACPIQCGATDNSPADSRAETEASELKTTDRQPNQEIKPDFPKLTPERFREVDQAASLMIWLVFSCGLGGVVMLLFIIFGARRIRRMTRSQVLKSKYDELEYLRLKHRREVEDSPSSQDEPKTGNPS